MRKPRSRGGKKLSWERLGCWVQDPPETLPFYLTLAPRSESAWGWQMDVKLHGNTLKSRLFHSTPSLMFILHFIKCTHYQCIVTVFIVCRLGSHRPASVLDSTVSSHSLLSLRQPGLTFVSTEFCHFRNFGQMESYSIPYWVDMCLFIVL